MNTNHILNVLLTFFCTNRLQPVDQYSGKETNEGVMFNDNYKDDYSLKPTSHFRSKSLSHELSFVATAGPIA